MNRCVALTPVWSRYPKQLCTVGLLLWTAVVPELVLAKPISALQAISESEKFAVPTRMAVIDMGAVFNASEEFQHRQTVLKREANTAGRLMKESANEIQTMKSQLGTLARESEGYADLDFRIKRKVLDLEAFQANAKKTFTQKEAEIYRDIHTKVLREVELLAAERGIDMVLRKQAESTESLDPQDVLKSLSRQLVFYNPQIDITQDVIRRMHRPKE